MNIVVALFAINVKMSLSSSTRCNSTPAAVSVVCNRYAPPPIWNEPQLDAYVRQLVDEVFRIPYRRARFNQNDGSFKLLGASSENFTELEAARDRCCGTSQVSHEGTMSKKSVRDVGTNVNFVASQVSQQQSGTRRCSVISGKSASEPLKKISESLDPQLKAFYSQISLKVYKQCVFPSRRCRGRSKSKDPKSKDPTPKRMHHEDDDVKTDRSKVEGKRSSPSQPDSSKVGNRRTNRNTKRRESSKKLLDGDGGPCSKGLEAKKNQSLKAGLSHEVHKGDTHHLTTQKMPSVSIRGSFTVQEIYSIDLPPEKTRSPGSRNVHYEEI